MKSLLGVGFVLVVGVAACASAQHPMLVAEGPSAQKTDASPTSKATLAVGVDEESKLESSKEEGPESVPTSCGGEIALGKEGKETKLCVPSAAYAKKLCSGSFPEVALGLFAKGTPWSRLYLAGDVEAWNASGGRTHRTQLAFDEEVIVLAKHASGAATNGIVMTGAMASYDMLRSDGTCVSVMEGELTTQRPPKPKPAPVPFSRLEETTRRALLASPKVKSSQDELTKACTSVASPPEKAKCEKADKAFSQAILDAVKNGMTLPTPSRRP